FFFGCTASMALAAAAPNVYWLAGALLLLGIFAAIYHPVGIPMLVSVARDRGRDFATNGVWGNFGVALAPGVTAALIHWVGLRAAFVVPAVICGAIGVAYLFLTKEETAKAGSRAKIAEVPLTGSMMVGVFAFFALMAFCGGTVFNILTIAIPKLIDERMTHDIPLVLLGSVATGVLLFGGIAQLTVGRLVSRFPPHVLLAGIGMMQVVGVLWAYYATGSMLLAALAVSIAAIYAQVTVGDVVIARYTADAWRGRVFAVRFFLAFITSGLAVWLISALLGKGGFDLVERGDVGFREVGFGPAGSQFVDDASSRIGVDLDHTDCGAFLRQLPGDGPSDAFPRTRHHRHRSVMSHRRLPGQLNADAIQSSELSRMCP
ncbi:MAG: MFS transporter, partial [Propionibacteriaceae bacterium]|nr:MFS transporter [Propionibacteriaceae bacterium]